MPMRKLVLLCWGDALPGLLPPGVSAQKRRILGWLPAVSRACWGAALSLVMAVGMTGCGGGQRPFANSVPVSGTVTFKGQPLAQGVVRFAPTDGKGQPVIGSIKDGRFAMNTTLSSPGVVAGRYKVAIVSDRPMESPPLGPDGLPPQVMPKPESLIPTRYRSLETSGIELDVVPGLAPLVFELQE